jgi:acyl-[acyl-carrier-protein]-phospholipid O-acyltransferase/long-chain-fatty-acid--[acyl-carrier-protein] ligase
MRFIIRFLLKLFYGFRVLNEEITKTPGPVLLIPNHVSWLDWLFVGACLDEDWRFVTSSVTAQTTWVHRWLLINRRTFPVDTASPYAVKRMAEYLQKGGRLVLFAEGRISTTTALMKLYEGTGFLLARTQARVITCYLRGAVRIPWVRQTGWTQWFPRLSVHFSALLDPPRPEHTSGSQARQRLTAWLRDRMMEQQLSCEMIFGPKNLPEAVLEMRRHCPNKIILEDVTRKELTYRQLWLGADLLEKQLRQRLIGTEPRVGILLPNLNATVVILLAVWSQKKTPCMLNFSTGIVAMIECARLAGLRQIVTSKTFLEKARIDPEPFLKAGLELIPVEDLRAGISGPEKIKGLLRHRFRAPRPRCRPEASDTAVVLFTSGSEGTPKGVELTHANVLSNIRQMLAVVDVNDHDRMFNAMPLFHSFGITVGALLPLVRGIYSFIYPSPLHYRIIPAIVYDRNCTVLLGTNTFLNGWARKAHGYDFNRLRLVFGAAEKIQDATVASWCAKFGVRMLEGYGATECSPCVSVNSPLACKMGTAGRLMPAIAYKLESVEGVAEGGRLLVRGPNIMKGYLNTEANATFLALDGWYDTGDIASVDADGFLKILGRLKRFAKVSGEMVSLTAVEDALAGAFPHYGPRFQIAILTRPDDNKGELIVAVSNEPRLQLNEIREAIKNRGMSNLCAPRLLQCVKEIPKLGTGKVNYRELAKGLQ